MSVADPSEDSLNWEDYLPVNDCRWDWDWSCLVRILKQRNMLDMVLHDATGRNTPSNVSARRCSAGSSAPRLRRLSFPLCGCATRASPSTCGRTTLV